MTIALIPPASAQVGRLRWTLCALLFCATTINYMDRQVLGLLAPTLQQEIGWSEVGYGWQVSFLVLGAVGFLWIGPWYWFYRSRHQSGRVSATEQAHIRSEPPEASAEKLPVLPVMFAAKAGNLWVATVLIGLAALTVMHFLVPTMKPAELPRGRT